MAKFKDFGSSNSSADAEPISFKLAGEDFHCRPQIPGKVMLDLASKTGDEENPTQSARMIDEFFRIALLPESHERFTALTLDPDRIITMEQLMEIVSWLVEVYAERPTSRPEVSSNGQ